MASARPGATPQPVTSPSRTARGTHLPCLRLGVFTWSCMAQGDRGWCWGSFQSLCSLSTRLQESRELPHPLCSMERGDSWGHHWGHPTAGHSPGWAEGTHTSPVQRRCCDCEEAWQELEGTVASLWLGRSGSLSLGPGRCASCSGVGILLGRSCHVSAGVLMGPGDTITSGAGSGICRSWKGSSSFLLGLCRDTTWRDTRAYPGPGCLSSLAGPPWALGQVRVLSRWWVLPELVLLWECSGGLRRG